jgi:N4-gp56 family major capsid protein
VPTTITNLTGGATGATWDLLTETAFDRSVEYYLRDEPQWRQLIDKKPVDQAMPGDVVTLTLHNPFAALATTPLTENVDPDFVTAVAPTRVQVTINEWGNAALTTLRLRELAFTKPDREIAELIGRNMYDSVDAIIRSVADAGTNILWVNGGVMKTTGGTDVGVTATDLLTRNPATAAVKLLQRQKVMPKQSGKYVAVIHPDTAFDLQAENSATAWNSPHQYQDTANIYSGAVGDFQGARYIETTRTTIQTDGAAGGKVYSTYFFGRQALVEAAVEDPHIVIGPQTDKFKRFFPIGWYALAGWSIYRPQALVQVRTCSSIATL